MSVAESGSNVEDLTKLSNSRVSTLRSLHEVFQVL